MGSIISARCNCGYENNEMFLGGGRIAFTTTCNFPFYCEECKILFETNLLKKKRECPECSNKNIIAYDEEKACKYEGNIIFSWNIEGIDRELKLTDGKYICPSCGKFSLSFFNIGFCD